MRSFVSVGLASALVGALGAAGCGGDDTTGGTGPDAATDGSTPHDAAADTSPSHPDGGVDATAQDAGADVASGDDGGGGSDASDGATGVDASDGATGVDASDGAAGDDASDGAAGDDGGDATTGDDGGDASDSGPVDVCADAGNNELSCQNMDFTGPNAATYDPVAKVFTFHFTGPIAVAAVNLTVDYTDEFGYSMGHAFASCQVAGNTVTCDMSAGIDHQVLQFTLVKLFVIDQCGKETDLLVDVVTPTTDAGPDLTVPWDGSCLL